MVAQQTASRLAAVTALTAVVLLAAGPAAGQTHRALAVGNSYSFYNQPQHAAGVYEALVEAGVGGWETAETQLVAGGGYTLADHAADLNAATALAEALVTGTGAPFAWDVVILQDQSLVPGLGPLDGLYAASLAGLETLDEAVQARGADTVLMQTWGRRDGASQLAWLYPDFETMNDLLAEGYAAYQVAITTPERTAWVAPVGAAFARIHADISAGGVDPVTDGTLFHRLYTSDGSHPSDLGSFLAGCVLFATVTGHDPGGVWVPEGVAPADADVLAKAARRVVIDEPFEPLAFPFGERPRYPWVFDWSSWVAANPADEPIVSHPTMRATVSLAADLGAMARLEIGADHDGAQGAGRLVLVDHSAKLDLGELVVGGGGDGTMSQNGGIVTADTLVLGESAEANGRYTLTAGALRVGALTHGAGSGSFSMSGGTLVAAQISAGLLQGGGALQVAHDEATMIDGVYFQQAGATLKVAAARSTCSVAST